MSGAVIEMEAVSKRFGRLSAVNALSLAVQPGEIFGLVGPDGAGKTTTVRMLAGVMRPDQGRIVVDGVDVAEQPEEVKRHVSYMPQRFGLYEELTVDENIRFYADLFEVPRQLWQQRAADMLAASNMTAFRQRRAGQLSGGMKQKLGLTCSLVHTPKVLLLDEPTTGVDPLSRREFWQILQGLRSEGVAMVISTAYLDEAERCDRLALLHEGRLVQCDTPDRLIAGMPGALLEVVTPQPRQARGVVQQLAGVHGVLLIGIGAHIHVDDAERRRPEIAAALAQAGVPVNSIEPVRPTIEDLFVALLEHQERAPA